MRTVLFLLPLLLLLSGCVTDTNQSKSESNNAPSIRFASIGSSGNVSPYSKIIMTFRLDVNTSTLLANDGNDSTVDTIDLRYGISDGNLSSGFAVPIDINYSQKVLTISPKSVLEYDQNYTIIIYDALFFTDGSKLDDNYTYAFSTLSNQDTTPPAIKVQYPTENATDVSVFTSIGLEFSEEIDTVSSVELNGVAIPSPLVKNRNIFANPTVSLKYATNYTVNVNTVADKAGNTASFSYSFTTQAKPTKLGNYNAGSAYVAAIEKASDSLIFTHFSGSDFYSSKVRLGQNDEILIDSNLSFDLNLSAPPQAYDHKLFIPDANGYIYRYDMHDNNGSFTSDNNMSVNGPLALLRMNADRACLIYETNEVALHQIFPLSNHQIFSADLNIQTSNARYCHIEGRNVFVAADNNVSIYDYNGSTPSLKATIETNATTVRDLDVQSNLLAIPVKKQVRMFDITTLSVPSEYNPLEFNVSIGQIEIFNNYLFVLEKEGKEFYVVDITNPNTAFLQLSLSLDHNASSFVIEDGTLITANIATASEHASTYSLAHLAIAPFQNLALSNSPLSAYAVGGYYFVPNSFGVEVLDKEGNTLTNKETNGSATKITGFQHPDNNKTYLVVADGNAGVKLYRFQQDSNGTFQSMTLLEEISGIGTVYDVATYEFNNSTPQVKILIPSLDGVLYSYHFDTNETLTATTQENNVSDTVFGALFAIEVDEAYTQPRFAVADYSNHSVYIYTIASDGSYTHEHTQTLAGTSRPRDLEIHSKTGDLFVALGSRGIAAIDIDNAFATSYHATPGYAMQIDSASEHNSSRYVVFVADYSGVALFEYENSANAITNFEFDEYIGHKNGALFGVAIQKERGEMRGVLSVDNTAPTQSRLFGHNEGARSFEYPLDTDPVSSVQFIGFESNTTTKTFDPDPF